MDPVFTQVFLTLSFAGHDIRNHFTSENPENNHIRIQAADLLPGSAVVRLRGQTGLTLFFKFPARKKPERKPAASSRPLVQADHVPFSVRDDRKEPDPLAGTGTRKEKAGYF
jgi:hypothetical protein